MKSLVWPLGRVLEIDLTNRTSRVNVLEDEDIYKFLGGRGT